MYEVILLGAMIVLLCIVSTKVSTKFNIPSLLIFIGLGMLFGSDGIFKIEFSDYHFSEQLCTICLIYIMFYGGFCMNWKYAKGVAIKASLLSTLGIVLTCVFVAIFTHLVFKVSLLEGCLIGAVLSSTDAASLFTILRMKKLNLKGGIAPLLEMESGSNDPFAYMLTMILLSVMANTSVSIPLLVVSQIVFGIVFGLLCGSIGLFLSSKLHFKEVGLQSIFVVVIALLSFSLPSMVNGNGFLSVYITGIILGNAKIQNKVELVHFFDAISQMSQIVLFFVLGLLAFPSQIPDIAFVAITIFIFLTLIARPCAVFICLSPFKVPLKQQLFVAFSGLRGAASIVFAIMCVVSSAYTSNDIFHIVFFVSLLSITLQGTLLPYVAKKLNVEDENNDTMSTFNDYLSDKPLALLEVKLSEKHPWINQKLQHIVMPSDMLVVAIKRGKEMILPKGNSEILKDDILVICSFSYEGSDLYLEEVHIDEKHFWVGMNMNEIDVANHFLVVMIKRKDEIIVPTGDSVICVDDTLVMCKKDFFA
ncbi:MAG: potassium/proton antiporter [Erysipelotrichia bacterium]|nr:potassium/proton antiporter [Erysipelotrichia bacterium]